MRIKIFYVTVSNMTRSSATSVCYGANMIARLNAKRSANGAKYDSQGQARSASPLDQVRKQP
jgi:hypothetical protein